MANSTRLNINDTRIQCVRDLVVAGSALSVKTNGLFQYNFTGFNTGTTATTQTVTNGIYTVVFNGINYWWCRNSANVGGLLQAYNFVSTTFPCDDNLKFNETTLTGGITTLKKLQPKKYKQVLSLDDEQIDANGYDQIGFIAQELEEVLPEAVRGHEGNKSIMDNSLIPVLTKAIQELSQQVTDLKAEVESLKQ